MDNHFHLLVRTPRANLSSFMQRLLTAEAVAAVETLSRQLQEKDNVKV